MGRELALTEADDSKFTLQESANWLNLTVDEQLPAWRRSSMFEIADRNTRSPFAELG